jgi:pimeloyl-ACP methyl ester carboxylesterase
MSSWFEGEVVANGIKQHYARTGGDRPVLVLAHGATDSGLCWTRLALALESDYDVVMPDARGHGLSEAPENAYGSVDQAADLAALIDALGLGQPAVGGHSMGARTVMRLVADYPGLATCAFLEDPPIRVSERRPATPGRPSPGDAIRQTVLTGRAEGREALLALGRSTRPTWAEIEFEPWVDAKLHVSDRFLNDFARPLDDWRDLLARASCPVLLITADPERGAIVTPEAAEAARQIQPALRVERIGDAGHNIRREQFDHFLTTVRAFLAQYARARAAANA